MKTKSPKGSVVRLHRCALESQRRWLRLLGIFRLLDAKSSNKEEKEKKREKTTRKRKDTLPVMEVMLQEPDFILCN
jgi:hypothetical protein